MRDQNRSTASLVGLLCLWAVGCQQQEAQTETTAPELSVPSPADNTESKAEDAPTEPAISPAIAVCGETPVLQPNVPGSPGKLIESKINPNGQSELAHLMRKLLAEMKANKERAEKATPLLALSITDHGKIRCSWPTTESMRGGAYDPMARQYLSTIEAFNSGPKDGKSHNSVVDACITCHKATCDGPTMAIEAVRFTESPEGTVTE